MKWLSRSCFMILMLVPVFLQAQEAEVKRERVFTGSGLYGFMNGGAEQFLEYGVSKLTARDVVYKGEEYTVEIYEMPSPEDAFGIYSLHVFRCERADTLGCIDCLSPYQLQTIAGSKYVSVVFPSGSAASKSKVDELVRKYVSPDGENGLVIPEQVKNLVPYSGKLKFLRGPIGISGVSTSLSQYLKGISYAGVWFVADKETSSYRACIFFNEKVQVTQLKGRIPVSDIIEEGDNYLYIKGQEKDSTEEDQGDFGF